MLDAELRDIYGELQNTYDSYNKTELINNVVVAYEDAIPVGCGCFKTYTSDIAEVKRMFVPKDFRGKSISKMILSELERWMIEKKFIKSILETGVKQTAAISLYSKSGYLKIENYGPYAKLDTSVCMSKVLQSAHS